MFKFRIRKIEKGLYNFNRIQLQQQLQNEYKMKIGFISNYLDN